jgi:hypothetical protein
VAGLTVAAVVVRGHGSPRVALEAVVAPVGARGHNFAEKEEPIIQDH